MRKMLLQGPFWKHLICYLPQSGEYPMLKCNVITHVKKKKVPRKNIVRFRNALFSYLVKSLEYTSSNLTQVETLQYVNWPFSLSPPWCIDAPALFKTWQWHVPTECAGAPKFYYIRACPSRKCTASESSGTRPTARVRIAAPTENTLEASEMRTPLYSGYETAIVPLLSALEGFYCKYSRSAALHKRDSQFALFHPKPVCNFVRMWHAQAVAR